MPPVVASTICTIGILGLFYIDRGGSPRLSNALWIPAIWLFIISSRPLSMWLGITGPTVQGLDATQAYVEGSPLERNLYTFLILAALAVLLARVDRVGSILRKNTLLLSYLVFCAVSVAWSDFPLVAFKRWTKVVGDVAIVLVILTETHPLTALKRLVSRLSFLLFPLSILFIKYYPHIGRRVTNSWTNEAVGITTQKNSLGLICLMYGVLFLWMFWSVYRDRQNATRSRRLWAYGTILAMIVWLLIHCNSTTSIVGLTSTAVVMWLLLRTSRQPMSVHVLVLAVLGMSTAALFLSPGGDVLTAMGKDPTLTGRTITWDLVLGMHTNPLIGTGFESFWLGPRLEAMRGALPNFPVNEAHNGWIEVYINLGWIGVVFIVALTITAYRRLISGFCKDPQTATLFLGFLLSTLFNAFSENAFRLMTVSWVFFVIVIIAGSQDELFRKLQLSRTDLAGAVVERDVCGPHENESAELKLD